VQILGGRRAPVTELEFSRCGRWLAAAGYGGLHVWDTADPTAPPQHPELPDSYIQSLVFRTDGRVFVNGSSSRWFLYDPLSRVLTTNGRSWTGWAVPSPDGLRVVRMNEFPSLRTYTFGPRDTLVPGAVVRDKRVSYFRTAAFAPDGATFAILEHRVGETPIGLTLRNAETAKPIRELKGAFPNTFHMLFSKDGAYLIARLPVRLACWNLAAEPAAAPRLVTNPSRKHFVAMAVHPDGPLLTVDNDRLVRVWSVPALATDRSITWNIGRLFAVAVSPDGTRAGGSVSGEVLVWDWD
jgi:WD40 repeat protein